MEKRTTDTIILLLIWSIVMGTRLFFAFSTPLFTDVDSYYHLRQAEQIARTGLPLFWDDLSFGGREHVILPAYDYVIGAIFAMGLSPAVAKIVTNLLASSTVFIVYAFALALTKNSTYARYAAGVSGFIPVYVGETFNTLTPLALFIPLFSLSMYLLLFARKRLGLIILVTALLAITDSLAILFAVSIGVYLLILYFSGTKIKTSELELCAFLVFFIVWVVFLVYQKALALHGIRALWNNIPQGLFSTYFQNVTFSQAVYGIGFVPVLMGVFVMSSSFLHEKNKATSFLTAVAMTTAILLILNVLRTSEGLIILGMIGGLLFAQGMKICMEYLHTTKISSYARVIAISGVLFACLTTFVPSIASASIHVGDTLSLPERDAFLFLREATPAESTVLSLVEEGHYVTEIAGRKSVIDTDFLLIPNADEIYDAHMRWFRTTLETEAKQISEAYDVDYVYFSRNAQVRSNSTKPRHQTACFVRVFENSAASVYRNECEKS